MSLIIAIIALQFADWWTTREIIRLGGHEKTDSVAWLMARVGIDAALAVKTALVLAFVYLIQRYLVSADLALLGMLVGYYLAVIVNNMQVLGRLRTAAR